MAELKSTVPRRTKKGGAIILNADDPLVRRMARKSKADPIYFTMTKNYNELDRVFYLNGNYICKKIGVIDEPVINIKEMPITLNGERRFNIANVMAALAAVEGARQFIHVDSSIVQKTLEEFGTHSHDNLATFHRISIKGEHVILCNAKNPTSFRLEAELINKIRKKKCLITFLASSQHPATEMICTIKKCPQSDRIPATWCLFHRRRIIT